MGKLASKNGFTLIYGMLLLVLVFLILFAGWLLYKHHRHNSITTNVNITGLKQPIQGLIDKDSLPLSRFQSTIQAFVVNVNWSDLQPSKDGPIASNNSIDQAIATVRQINTEKHLNLKLRLRVYTGIGAPDWVKNLDGPAISPFTLISGGSGSVGRFWTDNYAGAYQDLQTKLAAKYDSVPEIRETDVTMCALDTDEPFRTNANLGNNGIELIQAGYTISAGEKCETRQLDISRVWKHTLIDLDLSNYLQTVTSDGKSSKDTFSFTQSVLNYCRQIFNKQCVLMNTSLNVPNNVDNEKQLYSAIQQAGPPISYQTIVYDGAKKGAVGAQGILDILKYGISLGANSIELHSAGSKQNSDYQDIVTPDQLQTYNQSLIANPL